MKDEHSRHKPEPKVPVYILDGEDLVPQVSADIPVAARQHHWGSPWLWTALILTVCTYIVDAGGWMRPVEASIDHRQQYVALGPYRLWAMRHPISYEEIVSNPGAWDGQVVIWDIGRALDGGWCLGTDAAKKIIWSASEETELAKIPQGGVRKVLSRIEGSNSQGPLLALLEVL